MRTLLCKRLMNNSLFIFQCVALFTSMHSATLRMRIWVRGFCGGFYYSKTHCNCNCISTKAINWRQRRAMCLREGDCIPTKCVIPRIPVSLWWLVKHFLTRTTNTIPWLISQRIQRTGKKRDHSKVQKGIFFTYLWNALDSTQIQRPKTMKFRMGAAWQSYAFACHDLDKRPHPFDSIWQMANIAMHCECDRRGILPAPTMHPIGMVLLQVKKWEIFQIQFVSLVAAVFLCIHFKLNIF